MCTRLQTSLSDASVSSSVSAPAQQDFAGSSDVYAFEEQGYSANTFAGPAAPPAFEPVNSMDTATPSDNHQYFPPSRDSSQAATEYSAMTASWQQS